jgi:hypothetical protein
MRFCRVECVVQRGRSAFVVLMLTLGGCSTSLDLTTLYAQPGKYDYLRCQDITGRLAGQVAREKELMELTNKANQDVAGPAVSAAVYAADLAQTRAEAKLLREAAKQKNCENVEPKQ